MGNLAPTIDKGAGGSKSVKVNRMTVWRINVKGEPPPTFSWWKDGHQIVNSEEHQMEREEYQGGSTAILQILKTQFSDAGTYTLRGENKNGNLECRCSQSFRTSELSPQLQIAVDFGGEQN